MISTHISRASAAFLGIVGLLLVFASDLLLPSFVSNFPRSGAWLGQMLGAAWFAVATLNRLNQSTMLGGIYGRPVVVTNATLYFVTAMVGLKVLTRDSPRFLWLAFVLVTLFCGAYAWLLVRGPFNTDVAIQRNTGRS